MSLSDISENIAKKAIEGKVNITLNIDELQNFGQQIAIAAVEQYKGNLVVKTTNELFTRQKTAEMLHITLPTLWKYTKNGLIQSVRIGNRILYTEQSIINAQRG